MSRVAVLTDSNSGITQAEGKELGIGILPMPFFIDGEEYFEEITLSQEEFYERLKANHDIKTSQPAPGDVMGLWDKYLEEYDEIVYIPMSSGLSSSCETAMMLADDYDGRVQVVNNQRISVTQRQSVKDAIWLASEGKSAAGIREILEKNKFESSIYITEISEKGRKNHTGRCSNRNSPESETGSADPGRKAGCLCQGQRMETGEEDNARRHGKRPASPFWKSAGTPRSSIHLL